VRPWIAAGSGARGCPTTLESERADGIPPQKEAIHDAIVAEEIPFVGVPMLKEPSAAQVVLAHCS
jgi:hypothetical protein